MEHHRSHVSGHKMYITTIRGCRFCLIPFLSSCLIVYTVVLFTKEYIKLLTYLAREQTVKVFGDFRHALCSRLHYMVSEMNSMKHTSEMQLRCKHDTRKCYF